MLKFIRSPAGAVVVTAVLGVALAALSITVLGSYGWALFVGLPFCLGLVVALLRDPGTLAQTLGTATAATAHRNCTRSRPQ